ncbi:MAG: hypothetical protein ACX930_13485 [Erythrobacter sp.]
MDAATRRGAIGAIFGLGMSGALVPRTAFAQSSIGLPAQPLKLTRQIKRSLRDGNHVSVERSWQVSFAQQGQGVAVSGSQMLVDVDAPPSLAPLAAIERARSTADMWPILLTGSGLIAAAGSGAREDDVSRAVRVASDLIAARTQRAAQRELKIEYLAQLARAGSALLDRLPDDLFFPTVGPVHTVRSVDLPGGLKGEFELSYEAIAVPGKGWLQSARRQVVTRLAGTQQTACEDWSLSTI